MRKIKFWTRIDFILKFLKLKKYNIHNLKNTRTAINISLQVKKSIHFLKFFSLIPYLLIPHFSNKLTYNLILEEQNTKK
jgi:hypothetical protein